MIHVRRQSLAAVLIFRTLQRVQSLKGVQMRMEKFMKYG